MVRGFFVVIFCFILISCQDAEQGRETSSLEPSQADAARLPREMDVGSVELIDISQPLDREVEEVNKDLAGFAAYLPETTDCYYSLYQLEDWRAAFSFLTSSSVRSVWRKLFGTEVSDEDGAVLEKIQNYSNIIFKIIQSDLFGEECFVSYSVGKSRNDWSLKGVLEETSFDDMRELVEYLGDRLSTSKNKDSDLEDYGEDVLARHDRLFRDIGKSFPIPKVYCGGRMSNSERRKEVLSELSKLSVLGKVTGSFEIKDGVFHEVKIKVKDLVEPYLPGDEVLKKEWKELFLGQIYQGARSRSISLIYGEIADYVLIFLGGERSDFVLCTKENSLWESSMLDFPLAHEAKDIYMLGYESALRQNKLSMQSYWLLGALKGMREGFGESSYFNEEVSGSLLREALDRLVNRRDLREDRGGEAKTIVVSRGPEWLIDTYGGVLPELDLDTPRGVLGSNMQLFFQSHWIESGEARAWRRKEMKNWVECIEECLALTFDVLSLQSPRDSEIFVELWRQGVSSDIHSFIESVCLDFPKALGPESVFAVDLKGSQPTLPKASEVYNQLPVPRVGFVKTVEDRVAISDAWKEVFDSIHNFSEAASEVIGTSIPLQKPMKRRADDVVSWYFPLLFCHDDFIPCVTLDDKRWMFASSAEFAEYFFSEAELEVRPPGCSWEIRLKSMWDFGSKWREAYEGQKESLGVDVLGSVQDGALGGDDLWLLWESLENEMLGVRSIIGEKWLDEEGRLRSQIRINNVEK